jgi:hypothetical protein
MYALLLRGAVLLAALSGSLWLFAAALGALCLVLYPISTQLTLLAVLAIHVYTHLKRK